MDFGWYGDLDLAAALDFLAGAPGVAPDRLGAVGMSMGGEQAIGAAAGDERLRAVVAEGATGRTRADQDWLDKDLQGLVHRLVDTIQYGAADLLTEASPPISLRDAVVAAAPRPVLVIAGGEGDEITVGRYLRDASPTSVELSELPDTPHTDGLVEHPREWEERVIGFLDRHLG
jgi:hypothetical protein